MKLVNKIVIGICIASFLQWLNYYLFLGLFIGACGVIVIEYNLIINYLKKTHVEENITLTFIYQHVEETLHPIKIKRKHYLNHFNSELQVENPQVKSPRSEEQQQQQAIKLQRKKYLKKLETYSDFLDELKNSEQSHGQQLNEFDSKLSSENEYTTIHKFNEGGHDILIQLIGINLPSKWTLFLPSWKDYKRIFKQLGACHLEAAKVINLSVTEQLIVLKKDYVKEIEEFRRSRRKLKHTTVESYQHYQKIMNEYNICEKDLQQTTITYNEMMKKKDDPTTIIKFEMKVKLQIQAQDNIRSKLTDARERLKEGQIEINNFNSKLHKFQKQYEEQRIVYLKQCFQTSLVGFEDLAHKMQTQITNLIILMDEDQCQIYPNNKQQKNQMSSPLNKSFSQLLQQGQVDEMSLNEQIKECQKQTECLLQQWGIVQKYNEEIEYFFRDLIIIFNQFIIEKDFNNVQKQLQQEKSLGGETLNIMVSSVLQGIKGMKEASKQLVEQLEKKRQEIAKCRLDMCVGRDLEVCAQRDLKKLLNLYSDEKALEQYQNNDTQNNSKTKKVAQHFFSEIKHSIKDVQFNIGKLAVTVGQTVSKVQKMSNLNEDDLREQQIKVNEEKKNLISLQGFTLKTIEDQLNKHNKLVSKMKKNLIDDLGRYAIQLNSHLRMIIDEMTENIQIILQREKLETQNDEEITHQIIDEQIIQAEESIEDLNIGTTELLVQKLLKVLVNDWKESAYFKQKIQKLLHKTFNKKRATILSEITVIDFKIVGDPPLLSGIQPLRQDQNEFLIDFDISFRGKIQFTLNTNILINWPKEYQVPVDIKVTISTFTSRIRLCFVPAYLGKSWLSMIGQPVLNLEIEPTILQKYNIAKIQQIADLIREFLIGKVKLMTYPNKLTVKLPLSKK